jgi:hypothetical protein
MRPKIRLTAQNLDAPSYGPATPTQNHRRPCRLYAQESGQTNKHMLVEKNRAPCSVGWPDDNEAQVRAGALSDGRCTCYYIVLKPKHISLVSHIDR